MILFSVNAESQFIIKGKITDAKKNALPGISIGINDSYDGATSDSSGNFSFRVTDNRDTISIYASSVGYKKYEQKILINNPVTILAITLQDEITELKAVVISAGSFEANDQKRGAVLKSLDVATTASANADVTSAFRTLPGTQQVGQSEGLFVRGGSAEETKVFIDGTLVNSFFYSSVPDISQRGRFSPFLFKGLVFTTGGYSALYGQALSSALILESVDLPTTSSGSVNVSSVGINNLAYEKLAKNKKSSIGISYSYLNLGPYYKTIKQQVDYFKAPVYNNIELNYRLKLPKNGMIKFYTYLNQNTVGVRFSDIDSTGLKNAFEQKNKNLYSNLSWKQPFGNSWKMNIGASYSINDDHIIHSLQNKNNELQELATIPFAYKNFNLQRISKLAQGRIVIEKKLKGLSAFRFGGEYQHSYEKDVFTNTFVPSNKSEYADNYKAAFAEADIYLTNNIALKAGSRFEHSSLVSKGNIAPRVSVAYKLPGNGQISAAYGLFYQKADRQFLFDTPSLTFQKAAHYIINYQKITLQQTFRFEVFAKKYTQLVHTFPDTSATGKGYANGIDIFWRDKKTVKGLDYWVSYSYLNSKRNYLNYPYLLAPNFAATHTASLVLKKFITKWKLNCNASYTYSSGRPYFNLRNDNNSDKYTITESGKTIPYHNLSIGFNYLPSIGKANANKQVVWIFTVSNLLGNKQVFDYRYSYNGLRKQEVTPPAKRFFLLACFISFGTDRTQEAINNTL